MEELGQIQSWIEEATALLLFIHDKGYTREGYDSNSILIEAKIHDLLKEVGIVHDHFGRKK